MKTWRERHEGFIHNQKEEISSTSCSPSTTAPLNKNSVYRLRKSSSECHWQIRRKNSLIGGQPRTSLSGARLIKLSCSRHNSSYIHSPPIPVEVFEPFSTFAKDTTMSQHNSLKSASTIGAKRSVLKRFERIKILKARGQWKEGQRFVGLPKTQPDA